MATFWVINDETLRFMFDSSEDAAQVAGLMGVAINHEDMSISVKQDVQEVYVRKHAMMPYFDDFGGMHFEHVEFSDVKAPGETKVIHMGTTCSGTIKVMEMPMVRANAHDQVEEVFNKPGRHIFCLANGRPTVLQNVIMVSWTAIPTNKRTMILVQDATFVFQKAHVFEPEVQIERSREGRGHRPNDDV